MLTRVLEPEFMDSEDEALDYNAIDHTAVNRAFVADFLAFRPDTPGQVLDLGTGTALIPIELCRATTHLSVLAVDAAAEMIKVAVRNVSNAGLDSRIALEIVNARQLPYPSGAFSAVISNSIVHHIPDPFELFSEIARVCGSGGTLFVRDLIRPDDEPTLEHLVSTYMVGASPAQSKLFADSLRAALTVAEVQSLVAQLGFPPRSVTQTSDRHWTWAAVCP